MGTVSRRGELVAMGNGTADCFDTISRKWVAVKQQARTGFGVLAVSAAVRKGKSTSLEDVTIMFKVDK